MSSKTCFAKSSCIVLASALFCTSLPALATSSTAGTNLAVQQQDQKLKGQVIEGQRIFLVGKLSFKRIA